MSEYLNKYFEVKESFGTLCCGKKFKSGEILKVWKHPTKNRLWITVVKGNPVNSGHNVKRSTLNRCCEEIDYD
jgi:hypothetical protein